MVPCCREPRTVSVPEPASSIAPWSHSSPHSPCPHPRTWLSTGTATCTSSHWGRQRDYWNCLILHKKTKNPQFFLHIWKMLYWVAQVSFCCVICRVRVCFFCHENEKTFMKVMYSERKHFPLGVYRLQLLIRLVSQQSGERSFFHKHNRERRERRATQKENLERPTER